HGIRVVLGAGRETLVAKRLRPGRIGQAAFHVLTGLEEGRDRRGFRIERNRRNLRLERNASASAAARAAAAAAGAGAAAESTGTAGTARTRTAGSAGTAAACNARPVSGTAAAATASTRRRSAVGAHPKTREIGLAVGRARRRRVHDDVAVRTARCIRFGYRRPLRGGAGRPNERYQSAGQRSKRADLSGDAPAGAPSLFRGVHGRRPQAGPS